MNNDIVQLARGRNDNTTLYHKGDGFFFILREKRGNRLRLKCRLYRSQCFGTAGVDLSTQHLYHLQEHNHGPDYLLLDDIHLRIRMIDHATNSTSGRTARQLLNFWRLRCRNPELGSRFTSSRMRSSLNDARRAQYPEIPCTLMSLGLLLGLPNMRALTTTQDGQDIILRGFCGYQGPKTVSVIFISWRFLQFLSSITSIHLDGTFKKRPKKPRCSQMYNIVTHFGGAVICIGRVLMRARTEAAYLALFNYIKNLVPNFNPRTIHCDFERAQMNALRAVWPLPCEICGCLWHYAVAFSCTSRKFGLQNLANDNEQVLTFIRCFCAVPLLPSDMIMIGVNQLWNEISQTQWCEDLRPLLTYFQREWQPRANELSVYRALDRTNNCSESDNHSLTVVLPKNRPSIWQCIRAFVDLEYVAWMDKLAADRGDPVNSSSRKWSAVLNDRRVDNLSTMLERHEISPLHFLHHASWSILAAVHYGLRLHEVEGSDTESESSDSDSDSD